MWQIVRIAKRTRESKARANLLGSFEFIVFIWAKEHDIWWWTKKPQAKSERKEEIFDWNWKISHTVPTLSLFRLPNALRLRSYRVRRFLRVKNDEQRKGDLKKFIVCLSCFIAKMLSFHNPFAETERGKPKKMRVIEMSLHSELCGKFRLDTQVIDALQRCPSVHWRNVKIVRLSLGFKYVVLSLLLPYRRAFRRLTHTEFSQMVASSRSSDSVIADWMWFFEKTFCCCSVGDLTPRL